MGILDSLFGGLGGQQQDPNQLQGPGYAEKMAAMLSPGLHQALQQAREQKATDAGLAGTPSLDPAMRHALAMNPALLAQQGANVLPQRPKIHTITNPVDGSTSIFQEGAPAGGGATFSPLPVTAAPEVAQGPAMAPAAQPPGGPVAPAAGPVPQPGAVAPPGMPTPPAGNVVGSNTLQGGAGIYAKTINAARAAGATQDQLINMLPEIYKEPMRAILSGREMPTAFSQRQADRANLLELAPAISPGFDMQSLDARNAFKKSYDNPAGANMGAKMTSLEKVLGHMDETGSNFLDLGNKTGVVSPMAHLGNYLANQRSSQGGAVANLNRSAGNYSTELNTYLSNNRGDVEARKDLAKGITSSQEPTEVAGTLNSDLNFVQKQLEGMEQQRDKVFQSDPEMAKKYQISSDHARALMASIQQKIAALNAQGGKAPAAAPAAAPNGLPAGWSVK